MHISKKILVFLLFSLVNLPRLLAAQTPPPNDAFANRLGLSGPAGQVIGTNIGATRESSEPEHAGNAGGSSVWWSWTAPATGSFQMNTRGSDFDTLLAIYTGRDVGSLTVVAANDDTFGATSGVTFLAQEGRTYRIAVDGFRGAMGNIVLEWSASGSISGQVTEAPSGSPLVGVRVDIVDTSGTFVSFGITDASGHYRTERGLAAGTYFAGTANVAGLIDMVYMEQPCIGLCTSEDLLAGTAIVVQAGEETMHIDFQLAPGGTVSGQVTEAVTGQPLVGVDVDIVNTRGRLVSLGFTDNHGRYITESGIPAGRYFAYTLNFSGFIDVVYAARPCTGFCADEALQGVQIEVRAGRDTSEIDFVLVRGGTISGRVTDATTGLPLQGGDINLFDSLGNFVSFVVTDDAGIYRFAGGLTPGTYFASTSDFTGFMETVYENRPCSGPCTAQQVRAGTPIRVNAREETPGINFAVQPDCQADGNVDGVEGLSPNDALLVWQYFLHPITFPLSMCQQSRADVSPPLGEITPADALCIFRGFLGIASCLGQ